jgi:hypothetical protein
VTKRLVCPPAPGPLEDYAAQFDPLLARLAQRRGFRAYLEGVLLPRDRNKTLTSLVGSEPVVGAQHKAVQGLQWFVTGPHDQVRRKLLQDLGEVVQDERVAVPAPPVPQYPVGQDDQVLGLLASVDHDPAELVVVDARHPTAPKWLGRLAAHILIG